MLATMQVAKFSLVNVKRNRKKEMNNRNKKERKKGEAKIKNTSFLVVGQGLIEAKIDSGIPRLGASNLGA